MFLPPRLQNPRILRCFLHGMPQKHECFCPEASKSSYFTCFLHGMPQKHECFSLLMPKMLENWCLFGLVSSKCSKMASARQEMSFLSLWSFGFNSWEFKSWAENARKSGFRSYLERSSLQMPKMLENGCLFGPVSSKCSKMVSARQKMSFLSLWSFGLNSW